MKRFGDRHVLYKQETQFTDQIHHLLFSPFKKIKRIDVKNINKISYLGLNL